MRIAPPPPPFPVHQATFPPQNSYPSNISLSNGSHGFGNVNLERQVSVSNRQLAHRSTASLNSTISNLSSMSLDSQKSYIGLSDTNLESDSRRIYRESRASLVRRSRPNWSHRVSSLPVNYSVPSLFQPRCDNQFAVANTSELQLEPFATPNKLATSPSGNGGWLSGYQGQCSYTYPASYLSHASVSNSQLDTASNINNQNLSYGSIPSLTYTTNQYLSTPSLVIACSKDSPVKIESDSDETADREKWERVVLDLICQRMQLKISKRDGSIYEMLGCVGIYDYGFVMLARMKRNRARYVSSASSSNLLLKKKAPVQVFDERSQQNQSVQEYSNIDGKGEEVLIKFIDRECKLVKEFLPKLIHPENTFLAQMKKQKHNLPQLIKYYNDSNFLVIITHRHGQPKSPFKQILSSETHYPVEWVYYLSQAM